VVDGSVKGETAAGHADAVLAAEPPRSGQFRRGLHPHQDQHGDGENVLKPSRLTCAGATGRV
jgi:hypothetical protein